MGLKCYWLEPLRRARLSMRVYYSSPEETRPCSVHGSYHNAQNPLFDVPETFEFSDKWNHKVYEHEGPHLPEDVDPSFEWPTHCDCGYEFTDQAQRQVFSDHLYARSDTGEIITTRDAGPGAMWDAEWLHDVNEYKGLDGRTIIVKCPNGREWVIDSRCSNCTLPDDNVHKCWIRHGDPPNLTVDKNGVTCSAGGGSIQAGDYHGFLINGEFT